MAIRVEKMEKMCIFLLTHAKGNHTFPSYPCVSSAISISHTYKMIMAIAGCRGGRRYSIQLGHCRAVLVLYGQPPLSLAPCGPHQLDSILNVNYGHKWIFGRKFIQLVCIDRKGMFVHTYIWTLLYVWYEASI